MESSPTSSKSCPRLPKNCKKPGANAPPPFYLPFRFAGLPCQCRRGRVTLSFSVVFACFSVCSSPTGQNETCSFQSGSSRAFHESCASPAPHLYHSPHSAPRPDATTHTSLQHSLRHAPASSFRPTVRCPHH